MAKRKSLGKKTRFEVFKRDSFTCQYCGRKAPAVVLELDHIDPVSKGGANEITNYVTSCFDCNRGKGNRTLDDDSVIEKKRAQLEQLQRRREQLEMMLEWEKSLDDIESMTVNTLVEFFDSKTPGFSLTGQGKATMKSYAKKYNIEDIMGAIRKSTDKYLKYGNDGLDGESVNNAFKRVGGILRNKDNPEMSKLYYIRGILRNRCDCDDRVAIILLKKLHNLGGDIDQVEEYSKGCDNWYEWRTEIENYIDSLSR